MSGGYLILTVVGVWLLLQIVILPKLGIKTWIRDSCQVAEKKEDD